MKIMRIALAAAVCTAALAPVSVSQAGQMTYMQCVRITERSCGFPDPVDYDAYQECVATNVPLNCGHLPGAPTGPGELWP